MQLEVTRELVRMLENAQPFAIATLVDAHGSTPQKVGARILMRADGTTIGTLGGGCIEAEVCEVAKELIGTGRIRLLDFALNEDIALDYGLACGGTEAILVDASFTALDRALAEAMLRGAGGERRGVVLTSLDEVHAPTPRLALWEDGTSGGDLGHRSADAMRVARRLLDAPRPRSSLVTIGGARYYADVFAAPPEVVISAAATWAGQWRRWRRSWDSRSRSSTIAATSPAASDSRRQQLSSLTTSSQRSTATR